MNKRKDGRYCMRFKMENGKTKYVYGATQKECEEKFSKAKEQYEIDKNNIILNTKTPLINALILYLKDFTNNKTTTLKFKNNAIKEVENNSIMLKKVSDITYTDLLNLLDNVKSKTNKVRLYKMLDELFTKLKDIGIVKYNYCGMIANTKINVEENKLTHKEEKHKYYTKEEIDDLLSKLKEIGKEDIATFVELLFYSGLRVSEALGLKWQDIDFEKGKIYVCRQAQTNGKTFEIIAPKTSSGNREIPLFFALESIFAKISNNNTEYIFLQNKGFNYNNILNTIKKVNSQFTFHSCRHTFATNCYKLGVSAKTTQLWLGHSNYATTSNIYIHAQGINEDILKIENSLFLNQ